LVQTFLERSRVFNHLRAQPPSTCESRANGR
jgi:hypothetical protein